MQIDLLGPIEWPHANINWQTDEINYPWQVPPSVVSLIWSQSCVCIVNLDKLAIN